METPAVTITPAAEDGMDPDAASENRDDENHEKNNDAEITAIPEITETPDTEETRIIFLTGKMIQRINALRMQLPI